MSQRAIENRRRLVRACLVLVVSVVTVVLAFTSGAHAATTDGYRYDRPEAGVDSPLVAAPAADRLAGSVAPSAAEQGHDRDIGYPRGKPVDRFEN